MKGHSEQARQRGVVLVISLLVLLVLGILSATMAGTSQIELRMAGNEEARIASLQQALAGIDAVLAEPANMPLAAAEGYRSCLPASTNGACDDHQLGVGQVLPAVAGALALEVVRVAPETAPVPVLAEDQASSAVHYRVARFEVQARHQGIGERPGHSALSQGVLVRLPGSVRLGGENP